MEYFDKKFKSISEEGNTSVPENLEWDKVKSGINTRLEDNDKIKIRSRKRWIYIILSTVGIALIISLIVLKCQKNENFTPNLDLENIASLKKSDSKREDKQSSKNLISTQNETEDKPGEEFVASETDSKSNVFLQKDDIAQNYYKENEKTQKINLEGEGKEVEESEELENGSFAFKTISSNPATLIPRQYTLKSNFSNFQINIPEIINPQLPKHTNRNRFNISAWGGPGFFRGNFSGDERVKVLRNPNSSYVLGQSYAMAFSTPFSDHSNLMGQLTYSNLYEEFEIEFDQAISILIKDALVKVDSNIITSRKTYYKRDTLVGAVERKHIRHYNNLKLISFGIQMEREFPINSRWTATGSLGFDYTYMLNSEGRTIKSDYTILDFSKDNSIFSKNHLGLALSLGINYHMNDSFIIGSNIFMQQYLDNWSVEEGLISRPQVFTLQAGVKYKL